MTMTKDAGAEYLYHQVQLPVFFDRLASNWNIRPANQAEAGVMLKAASQLAMLREHELQQQQLVGQSFLQKAAHHIEQQAAAVFPYAFDPLTQQIAATAKAAAADPKMIEACQAIQQA